ncbi:MAG: pilus assembly FimT family protein [Gammaproteobacteria bacterium]
MAARAGFTLTEMLIAVAILSALAAVAVPMLSAPDPERVELAAAELIQALRFARSESERTRVPHGLRVDAATETVQLFRLDTSVAPPARDFTVYHPVHRGLFALNYGANPDTAGVEIESAILSFAAACSETRDIVFDDRGSPRCADPVHVAVTGAVISLGDGATTRQIDIAGVTGRVVLQ